VSLPLVLVDDPTRPVPFDLVRTVKACPTRLAWIVEPVGASTDAAAEGEALAAACAATAGSPVALPRYRAHVFGDRRRAPAEFAAAQTAETLAGLVPPPFVLVVFVSRATLPLVEAVHADSRTRALLRIGITGWKLGPEYNLAQKLVAQGKLEYHEHAMTLERTFCQRLGRMLEAHAARARVQEAPPAAPESASPPPAPAIPQSAATPPSTAAAADGGPVSAST